MTKLEKEYNHFRELQSKYQKWMEGETTINQRIVSVRIDVSYSLKDWVQSDNEEIQSECYKAYLRLVDTWFSYEALLILADEEEFTSQSAPKSDKLLKSKIPNDLMVDLVYDFYNQLSEIINKPNRKQSLENYIDTLLNYPGTSKTQIQHLNGFKNEVVKGELKNENYSRILAFVYAIRNAYAHNGETARSGTNHYFNKLLILNISFNFILQFILRTGAIIYDDLISNIS